MARRYITSLFRGDNVGQTKIDVLYTKPTTAQITTILGEPSPNIDPGHDIPIDPVDPATNIPISFPSGDIPYTPPPVVRPRTAKPRKTQVPMLAYNTRPRRNQLAVDGRASANKMYSDREQRLAQLLDLLKSNEKKGFGFYL